MAKYKTTLLRPVIGKSAMEIVHLGKLSEYQILKIIEVFQISLKVKTEYVNDLCFIEVDEHEKSTSHL